MFDTEKEKLTEHAHVRDRVAQVYLGIVDWGPTNDVLRRRINWMAEQAQGPNVLDVGCSEGILEVLLARRGLDVTGVELNADALQFARELLAKEPANVRTHARLVLGDFIDDHPVSGLFDTVVLGEIIEHFDDPTPLLDRSLEYLEAEGRIVITTPFGLLPHEDHHQTFCLTNLIDLLKAKVELGTPERGGRVHSVRGHTYRRDRQYSWQRLDADAVLVDD